MSLLLDTHVVIWFLEGNARLGVAARTAIQEAERVYVSAATVWEISVKMAQGKLRAPADFAERLLDQGMLQLGLEWEHARIAGSLPALHRDPFDRMLVAQSIVERLTIVTRDAMFERYGVPVIAA